MSGPSVPTTQGEREATVLEEAADAMEAETKDCPYEPDGCGKCRTFYAGAYWLRARAKKMREATP